jgi:hypothetical protein
MLGNPLRTVYLKMILTVRITIRNSNLKSRFPIGDLLGETAVLPDWTRC